MLLAAVVALSACAPQTQLRGPAIQTPELAADHLVMGDGARLPMRRWMPEGSVGSVVIALHGFTDYRNAFSDLGTYLARRGIATYAYDQRGFGGTAGRGIWPGTCLLVEDLIQVIDLVGKLHPHTPIFPLGESMGAAVVLVAMKRHDLPDVSGAILVAPAVWGWRVMNPALAGLLRLLAHGAPWLPISAGEFRKLASDNQAMLEALDRDPLVLQSVRVDALYGLVTLMDDALESATSLRTPALVLYGARERIIPRAVREEFIRRLQVSQPVLIHPNGHHTLLRDRNAEVVLRDVARWIGDVSMPRGGQVAERGSDEQELRDRARPLHLHRGDVTPRAVPITVRPPWMIATASVRIRAKWPISGTVLGLSAVEGRYPAAGRSTARSTGGWAFHNCACKSEKTGWRPSERPSRGILGCQECFTV